MRLSMYMIEEELQYETVGRHLYRPAWELTLRRAECRGHSPSPFEPDVLYICRAEDLNSTLIVPGTCAFILAGIPDKRKLPDDLEYIAVPENTGLLELYTEVTRVFYIYQEWTDRLQDAVDRKAEMKKLAELSMGMIHNPISLVGTGYVSFFVCVPNESPDSALLQEYRKTSLYPDNSIYPQEELTYWMSNPDFINAVNEIHPIIYGNDDMEYRTLFYNLTVNQVLTARLLIDEILHTLTEADIGKSLILGDFYKKLLQSSFSRRLETSQNMENILISLLDRRLLPEKTISEELSDQHWNIHDRYICMTARLLFPSGGESELSPVAFHLSGIYGNECYTIYKERLVMVFNLSALSVSADQLFSQLMPFLRESLVMASFSAVFLDFKELYYYYRQAIGVESIGRRFDETKWYFRFRDYALDYFIEESTSGTIPDVFIPDGLKNLMEYDRENGTDYTELLRVYLQCERNISRTSRATWQHRNTVIYRLKKIEQLISSTLESERERILYQMAFQLLGQ